MTREQVESLNLSIDIDEKTLILVESALEWILEHTTLEFDIHDEEQLKALPATVKLFCLKFVELYTQNLAITSESISGLSQSFNTDLTAYIWDYAYELLSKWLKGTVDFFQAEPKW